MTLSSEDREAWLARWGEGRTRFHLDQVHPALMRFIGQVPSGARILVPLCGKSLDLGWLKDQGYNVVGVELAELAVSKLQTLFPGRRVLSVPAYHVLSEGGAFHCISQQVPTRP